MEERNINYNRLPEISETEFFDHIEDDDFFKVYGNPVIINTNKGSKIACIAIELYERMLRSSGQGEKADELSPI